MSAGADNWRKYPITYPSKNFQARDFTILEPISFPGSYLSQNAFLFSELRLQ